MTQFDTENKDVLLAMAIASGSSASAPAREMDLSLSTVNRRMADAAFRQLVASLRREMLTAAIGRVTNNMTRAAETLSGLLEAEEPYLRLRAARSLITLGLKLHESIELGERVQEIERALAEQRGY